MTHGADTSFLVAFEIQEHAQHAAAFSLLEKLLAQKDRIGVTPQVLAEFVHVVTDGRRFQQPLSVALDLTPIYGVMFNAGGTPWRPIR